MLHNGTSDLWNLRATPKIGTFGTHLSEQNKWIRLKQLWVHFKYHEGNFHWPGPPMWKVTLDTEMLYVSERSVAERLVQRYSTSPNPQECIAEQPAEYIEPKFFRWLAKKHAEGFYIGQLADHLGEAAPQSIDDAIAWYQSHNRMDPFAAWKLLALGFGADRPEAAQAVSDRLEGTPWQWFNVDKLHGPTGDFYAQKEGHEMDRCLFARMMQSSALTNWFFECQPQWKETLLDPDNRKALEKQLHTPNHAEPQIDWLNCLNHVLGVPTSPLGILPTRQSSYPQKLDGIYQHCPATQCYLLYNRISPETIVPRESASYHPDVQLFLKKLTEHFSGQQSNTLPNNPRVDNLMLAVHLGMSSQEFYHHAHSVFNGPASAELDNTTYSVDSHLFQ